MKWFGLLVCLAVPCGAQQLTVETPAVGISVEAQDKMLALFRAFEVGTRPPLGCFVGQVGVHDGSPVHADIHDVVIEEGCELEPETIGLFTFWKGAGNPAGNPVADSWLARMDAAFPGLVVFALVWDTMMVTDPNTGQQIEVAAAYLTVRTRAPEHSP